MKKPDWLDAIDKATAERERVKERRRKAWSAAASVACLFLIGFTMWSCSAMTERQEAEARVWAGSKIVTVCGCNNWRVWHRPTDNTYWLNKRWPVIGPSICKEGEKK